MNLRIHVFLSHFLSSVVTNISKQPGERQVRKIHILPLPEAFKYSRLSNKTLNYVEGCIFIGLYMITWPGLFGGSGDSLHFVFLLGPSFEKSIKCIKKS